MSFADEVAKTGRPQRAPRLAWRKARPEKAMRAKWVIRFLGHELATAYGEEDDYAAAKADLDYFKSLLAELQTSPEVGERSKIRIASSAREAFRATRWGRYELVFPPQNPEGNPSINTLKRHQT